MAQIEEIVTFEGILRREEMSENDKVKANGYGVEAITKGAEYNLADSLPYDFVVLGIGYKITEAFDGMITLGTDLNPTRLMSDTDFVKTVGKNGKSRFAQIEAGRAITLFLGPGTT